MPDDIAGQWQIAHDCAQRLVSQLSRQDKQLLLHGAPNGMGYAGYVLIPRAQGQDGGPVRLTFNDGPQGYNGYTDPTIGKGTQFPDLIAIAASWDPEVSTAYAGAIAEEFRGKGCNVLLGPDVEIVRAPLAGRSFESLSGEDPYLGGRLGAAYVAEVHRRGMIATIKHWLDNEQEQHRQEIDVIVGKRAQHELYMPSFKAAIDAGAGAVMCSYNKVNGDYACENNELLNKLLREDLGFRGFVVSDWGAVHSGAKSAMSGLNIEMPGAKYFAHLESVPDETVDKLAREVVAAAYAAGFFHGRGPAIDWKWPPPFYRDTTSDAHRDVARRVIAESTVLLKNVASTLPVSKDGAKIALVGKPCHDAKDPNYGQGSMYSAGGSGFVATTRAITPFDGLKALVGDGRATWSPDAEGIAADADVIVLCTTAHDEEGRDRTDLSLPQARELIGGVRARALTQRVVMFAIVPGAVETEWVQDVDAALLMFMPGEQAGPAFADLLIGRTNPGGRLPLTFPKADEQRFSGQQFPGVNLESDLSEGVLVGYRWNDNTGHTAAYPFGFGLSYSTVSFTNYQASCVGGKATVALTVTNTGKLDGVAVPQLYVGFKSLQPVVRQLRGFRKLHLQPGATEQVQFELGDEDWRFYDKLGGRWVTATELGEEVTVYIGASSYDLEWSSPLHCSGGMTPVGFQT